MIKKDTKKNNSTKNPLLEKNLMDDGNEANFDRTLRLILLLQLFKSNWIK